jgi:hypothetical protein
MEVVHSCHLVVCHLDAVTYYVRHIPETVSVNAGDGAEEIAEDAGENEVCNGSGLENVGVHLV